MMFQSFLAEKICHRYKVWQNYACHLLFLILLLGHHFAYCYYDKLQKVYHYKNIHLVQEVKSLV
jgi:hypothetical protein